jgi:hypothetical protein
MEFKEIGLEKYYYSGRAPITLADYYLFKGRIFQDTILFL